jgi:hypothetical protein
MKNSNSVFRAFHWIELFSSVLIIICFFLPYASGISPVSFTFVGFFGKPDLESIILTGFPMFFFLFYPALVIFENKITLKIPNYFLVTALCIYLLIPIYQIIIGSYDINTIFSILISVLIMALGIFSKEKNIIRKVFLVSLLSFPVFLFNLDAMDNIDFGGIILGICLLLLIVVLILRIILKRISKEIIS